VRPLGALRALARWRSGRPTRVHPPGCHRGTRLVLIRLLVGFPILVVVGRVEFREASGGVPTQIFRQRLDPIVFQVQIRPLVEAVVSFILREFGHVDGGNFPDHGGNPLRHEQLFPLLVSAVLGGLSELEGDPNSVSDPRDFHLDHGFPPVHGGTRVAEVTVLGVPGRRMPFQTNPNLVAPHPSFWVEWGVVDVICWSGHCF
jgi:hypothetical protein